jgi:hypothetical protein
MSRRSPYLLLPILLAIATQSQAAIYTNDFDDASSMPQAPGGLSPVLGYSVLLSSAPVYVSSVETGNQTVQSAAGLYSPTSSTPDLAATLLGSGSAQPLSSELASVTTAVGSATVLSDAAFVNASVVPVPAALWLFASGIAGMGLVSHGRRLRR